MMNTNDLVISTQGLSKSYGDIHALKTRISTLIESLGGYYAECY